MIAAGFRRPPERLLKGSAGSARGPRSLGDNPDVRTLVLIVEDDVDLCRLLSDGLEEEGYEVLVAASGRQALDLSAARRPALMVIDIGLPDTDGRDLLQALRSAGVGAPVLFLTALAALPDRLLGFSVGGDDYLTKPFNFDELAARLSALGRRSGPAASEAPAVGELRLDPLEHAVRVGAASRKLTPTEFRLLGALAARRGEAVRRRQLISAAWPNGAIVHDNTLDVYVARLRRKLRELSSEIEIHTIHQVGYELR